MANVAFFGVGTMGLPIVLNLLKAGHSVHTWIHHSKEGPEEAARHGAILDATPEQAVSNADFIFNMVSDDRAVHEMLLRESLREAAKPGAIIIEMTTCSSACVIDVQNYYAPKGIHVLDAPVTGGLRGAIDGQMIIIGAGHPEDFSRADCVLKSITKQIFNFGAVGNGKLVKAMTNLLGAVNMAALGEFYRGLAGRGLDMQQLQELMPYCAGGSVQSRNNLTPLINDCHVPASFKLKLMRKDMKLGLDEVQGEFHPLSDLAYRLYQNAAPYDEENVSAIVKVDQL